MEDIRQRENGRQKADQYKNIHSQWMIPQHQMKEHQTIKLISIMAERDNAVQERNLALSEKKAAFAERDMAVLQRDAALAERNNALMERDSALSALKDAHENVFNLGSGCSPGCNAPGGSKHIQHHHHHLAHIHPPHLSDAFYNQTRDMNESEAYPTSAGAEGLVKPRRVKRPRKEAKGQTVPAKKASKSSVKSRRGGGEGLNNQVTIAKRHNKWKNLEVANGGEDLNKALSVTKHEWRDQDMGLNQVTFDETTMPAPVCSCTGSLQQCYRWGNGGWQSACCTTTLSMHPLPVIPNRRHARVGGRKMSGSAFTKLLSRLAAEGHDLSIPLDLKDHWAKHGTNRYITIK